MIAVLVDKMIRTQIVDCAAVANFIFSPQLSQDFTRWDRRIFDFHPLDNPSENMF